MKPLLRSVSPELAEAIMKAGHRRKFGSGQEIFEGGQKADFLPVVISGRVKMIHFLEPGKEVIIGIFEEGEAFAVPPVFDGGVYPATSIAMEPSELLLIPRPAFLELLKSSSELSFAIISWMCAMLREKTSTIQNLATASPEHRIASVLLKLYEKEGGAGKVTIHLTRQDIARMAGLTTETTIRVIRRLAEQGVVEISHGKVSVSGGSELKRLTEN